MAVTNSSKKLLRLGLAICIPSSLVFIIFIIFSGLDSRAVNYACPPVTPTASSSPLVHEFTPEKIIDGENGDIFRPVRQKLSNFTPVTCSLQPIQLSGLSLEPPEVSLEFNTGIDLRVSLASRFNDAVGGWCGATNGYAVALFSDLQHRNGLYGSVGEIGVHYGKFFIALAHTSVAKPRSEKLFVCDLFSMQHLNVDKSGSGNKDIFMENVRKFGIDAENIAMYEGSSLDLTVKTISQLDSNLIPFRMFSIDGGHTFQASFSDMKLAQCIIADGGIVIMDDIFHSASIPAAMDYIEAFQICPNLVPFMLLDNKLWYTTRRHQQVYMDFALNIFRPIVDKDAAEQDDLVNRPQIVYAPQIAPTVFGHSIPIIAYSPNPLLVDIGKFTKIKDRWASFLREKNQRDQSPKV